MPSSSEEDPELPDAALSLKELRGLLDEGRALGAKAAETAAFPCVKVQSFSTHTQE